MNGFTKIAQQMLSQESIDAYNQNPFGYGRGYNPQPPPPPTMWDKAQERMGLAGLAGYMIPGVSTVMTGMDTINSLRKGDWVGAAANAAWMAGTLVPGAGFVKAMSLANKARKGMAVAGKAVARGAKAMQASPMMSRAGQFATPINNAVGAVGQRAGTFSTNMANKAQAAQGKLYRYNQFWDNHQRLQKNIGRAGTAGMVATMAPVGYEMYKGIRDSANAPAYSPANHPFMTGPYGRAAASQQETKEAQSSSITLGQLIQLIQSDSSISDSQKIMLVYQLKNSGLPSFTSVTPQSAGLLGAAISALVTKYLGFGNVATALSGLGGYAFGSSIGKKLNDPYPGYRITGMSQW